VNKHEVNWTMNNPNAGIASVVAPSWVLTDEQWRTMLEVNLTGVWHTTTAAIPHLFERGPGGAIVLISSTAGIRGIPNISHYNAAKHGVVGLSRTLANELAPHRIRVNTVHPTNVLTTMIDNDVLGRVYRPDLPNPTFADAHDVLKKINMWDVLWVESRDICHTVHLREDLRGGFLPTVPRSTDSETPVT
jgi:NAD(P)-dependent dehydrogenase (short-subunit alcohol dehydrogenase family)